MLVYREQRAQERPAPLLAAARRRLDGLAPAQAGAHDRVVGLLIALGVLEAGLADALHEPADTLHPVTGALRAASVAAGHLLWLSWHGRSDGAAQWIDRARAALAAVEPEVLPERIETRVPEGYAHYGVYPETYLAAAERVVRRFMTPRVVCIGIRSIGTSLSAAVTAALEELGCEVLPVTVRPRGHPFDRRPRFDAALASAIHERAGDLFVLVDEGPGISGSSLAGTARAIEELGVSEDRIVLMPSWPTDGRSLHSADARERWRRHPQLTATFDEVWVESGRLGAIVPGRTLTDLSAGAWRPLVFERPDAYPAVQPQHERRKFLARDVPGAWPAHGTDLVLRFAGLGGYGDGKLARARALADAGLGAAPSGLEHGFLIQEFRLGTPASAEAPPAALLDAMAGYLAHVRRWHPAGGEPTDVREMVATNVSEALGARTPACLATRLDAIPRAGAEPTALDGRMFPHEWLRTPAGYVKVDALDHHDDHFYPGPQDIAWDVAGTCVEFGLDDAGRRGFLDRYRRTSGDRHVAERLPAYALAYLAFRVGYATLAAEQLGATPDGARFQARAAHYQRQLASELAPDGAARWHL
jgi:hypothetical protein